MVRLCCINSWSRFSNVNTSVVQVAKNTSVEKVKSMKVKGMQISGIEAIRIRIQPPKPKREITKITKSQDTKRTYGQPSEQLFSKRWPLC